MSVMVWRLRTTRLGLLAITAFTAMRGATLAEPDPLARYRWTSRVLVVASEAGDPRLTAQREALAHARTGAAERDLVTIEALGRDLKAAALREQLHLPADGFHAVLIGKDGGAKLSSTEPIPSQRLFATIDAMPMRREEMRH